MVVALRVDRVKLADHAGLFDVEDKIILGDAASVCLRDRLDVCKVVITVLDPVVAAKFKIFIQCDFSIVGSVGLLENIGQC